jgi:hypothetical protein
MRAGLGCRTYSFGLSLAVQLSSEKVSLRCVLRRGSVIDRILIRIDCFDTREVECAGSHESHVSPITRNDVEVAPPVALAEPCEALSAVKPVKVADTQIDPGIIFFSEDRV